MSYAYDYDETLPDELFDRPSGKGLLDIPTAKVFRPLLRPARYYGARGGRSGGRSWFFASRLIEEAYASHQRVVCTREYQSSIKDSVKTLLEHTIQRLGVEDEFRSTETEIVGPNDSLFIFRGLNTPSTGRSGTAMTMKSLEAFSRCWVEEAQTISQRSLNILTPTFRTRDSRLYFSWNPVRPTDPVERLFEDNKGDRAFICVTSTYLDNPWVPEDSWNDAQRSKRRDPDEYAHVWLGEYERRSEAAVFRNWRIEEFEEPPRGTRFYYGADWGFSIDPTCLVRCFIKGKTLYVDYEAWEVGVEIDKTPELFRRIPQSARWPIRADSARPETISYMKRHGFPLISEAVKGANSVEDGIEFLRSFDIVIHERCPRTADELARYSWKVDPLTDEVLPILADKDNHICIAEGEKVLCRRGWIPIEGVTTEDYAWTRQGWKRVLAAACTGLNRETVLVETTIGRVYCTPDHPFPTLRGIVEAADLRYADEIYGEISWQKAGSNLSCGAATNTDATPIAQIRPRASISEAVKRVASFFTAMFGGFIMGRSLAATMSIMLMRIQPIMISGTWNVSPWRSTWPAIPGARSGRSPRLNIWRRSGLSPRCGTRATKAARSIVKLALRLMRSSFPSPSHAKIQNVGESSCQGLSAIGIASVPMPANRHGGEQAGLTMRPVFARFARSHLRSIVTATRFAARGHVITVSDGGRRAVYDLTIEDAHEFVVGGILVKNCDALRYALEGARLAHRPIRVSPEQLAKLKSVRRPLRRHFL